MDSALRVGHDGVAPAVLGELRACGPRRTASRSAASGKCEKNCHGVRAPHSSPMNSIGVNGEVNTSAAPQASRPGERVCGEPVAGGAVADLVVVLQVDHEPVGGDAPRVDGRAVVALPEARPRALVQERPGEHVGEAGEPAVAKSA